MASLFVEIMEISTTLVVTTTVNQNVQRVDDRGDVWQCIWLFFVPRAHYICVQFTFRIFSLSVIF